METENARILVIDDDPDILVAAKVVLRQRFGNVETLRDPGAIASTLSAHVFDIILLDLNFSLGKTSGREGLRYLAEILTHRPAQPVIVITAYGSINLAVEAMKAGALDFVVKPWDNEKLEETILAALSRADDRRLNGTSGRRPESGVWVNSTSAAMAPVNELIERISPTDASVLLLGETGTGKEVVAHRIHALSGRRNGPFIKVDLGAIHQTLFESELFGHKKGAFTDAREDNVGKVALAHKGTLFLDEIANLPLSLQSKLLSVLQNFSVLPVGSNTPVVSDFRVIAATNKDIHRLTAEGTFREDLLWRLNTVELTLPPLRERGEDLGNFVSFYIAHYGEKYGRTGLSADPDVIELFRQYPWPGNIRQLQHVIERAVILSEGKSLRARDFVLEAGREVREESINLEEIERSAIERALRKHRGNMRRAARELGFSRSTLYRKVQRYGL